MPRSIFSSALIAPCAIVCTILPAWGQCPQHQLGREIDYGEELINAFAAQGKSDVADELQIALDKGHREFRKLARIVAKGNAGIAGYWANLWLAHHGDKAALTRLWHRLRHNVSETNSQERAEAFFLWGRFKFYPASDYLLSYFDAANVLAAHEARSALAALYPAVQGANRHSEERSRAFHAAIQVERSRHPQLFRLP